MTFSIQSTTITAFLVFLSHGPSFWFSEMLFHHRTFACVFFLNAWYALPWLHSSQPCLCQCLSYSLIKPQFNLQLNFHFFEGKLPWFPRLGPALHYKLSEYLKSSMSVTNCTSAFTCGIVSLLFWLSGECCKTESTLARPWCLGI